MKIDILRPQYTFLVNAFDCGDDYFNNFLRSKDAFDNRIGTTYICLTPTEDKIIGYYNITGGSVDFITGNLRIKDSGAIHINYFAVTKAFQKNVEFIHPSAGIKVYTSDILLNLCIQTVQQIRDHILGVGYITLSSSEAGLNLYERNGFSVIQEDDDIIIPVGKNEYTSIPMYLFLDGDS